MGAEGIPFVTWHGFTPLGNAILVLPVIVCAAALLAWHHQGARLPVLKWLAAVALAVVLAAASKIAFYGWGTGVRAWDLTCFSGHTVLAFCCWPVLGALVAPRRWLAARYILCAMGIALASLIGWSRVRTGAHPVSEVIAGGVLGSLAAAWSVWSLRGHTLELERRAVLVPIVVVLFGLAAMPTMRLPSEHWMARVGIALSGAEHPVSRQAWRLPARQGRMPHEY